jgi:predicted PurR-regulated permease PerM
MKDRFLRPAAGLIIVVLAVLLLKIARPVLFPFVLAVFIAYLLDPALEFLAGKGVPKWPALAIILGMVFLALFGTGFLIYSGSRQFAASLAAYAPRALDLANKAAAYFSGLLPAGGAPGAPLSLNVPQLAGRLVGWLGSFFGFFGELALVFLFVILIIAGRGRGVEKAIAAAGPGYADRICQALGELNRQVRKYIVIKTAMSLANGLMVWIVLTLFRVDFAAVFGLLAFFLNYIPNIGSLIATLLRVGFAYFQFGNFWVAFWVLVVTVGLDTLMGEFIEPKVMGSGLGLSPLVVIFSLVFWGWLWGIPGLLLAVPLTAVVKIACRNVPGLEPVALLLE